MKALLLAVAVLASAPWQGVAFVDHTVTRYVPLGNTGIVSVATAPRAYLHASGLAAAPVDATADRNVDGVGLYARRLSV